MRFIPGVRIHELKSFYFSVMPVTWCVPPAAPSWPAVQHVGVSSAETSEIWPWKKWRPQSCSHVDISHQVHISQSSFKSRLNIFSSDFHALYFLLQVVAHPCSTPRKWTTRRFASTVPTHALVPGPPANGRDPWNKSCPTSCKSTNPSPHSRERTSFFWLQTLTSRAQWTGSWCKAVSGTILCEFLLQMIGFQLLQSNVHSLSLGWC